MPDATPVKPQKYPRMRTKSSSINALETCIIFKKDDFMFTEKFNMKKIIKILNGSDSIRIMNKLIALWYEGGIKNLM